MGGRAAPSRLPAPKRARLKPAAAVELEAQPAAGVTPGVQSDKDDYGNLPLRVASRLTPAASRHPAARSEEPAQARAGGRGWRPRQSRRGAW